MLRGMYTGATGMIMNQERMNIISNNLANVNKTAFKSDEAIFKSFPSMLLHRLREDGLGHVPLGSFDLAPKIGRLGTGVELNENFTRFEQGSAKQTGNPFDLMLDDQSSKHSSFFVVRTDRGDRLTRSGSFILNREGNLVTPQGFPLLGENGPIQIAKHNVLIQENGEIWINSDIGNEPDANVGDKNNDWRNPVILDQIQIRTVEFPRELQKEGDSLYNTTPESGPQIPIKNLPPAFSRSEPVILQGFLEASNVNLVRQMVNMISVQRSYEANQKSVTAHDQLLGKLINEVAR